MPQPFDFAVTSPNFYRGYGFRVHALTRVPGMTNRYNSKSQNSATTSCPHVCRDLLEVRQKPAFS